MNWSLECNGKHFYNKLEALQEQRSSKSGLYFNTPVAYDKIDFSTQDDSTLDQLCKAEAQKIRDTHDKVVIWYSGGSDSHYVLQTFIKNLRISSELFEKKKIYFVVSVLIYFITLKYFGYMLPTFFFYLVLSYLLGSKSKLTILPSIFSLIIIYFFFSKLLKIPLPLW